MSLFVENSSFRYPKPSLRENSLETFLLKTQELLEKGDAHRFQVIKDQQIHPAFCVRAKGEIKTYLNVCPHMGLKLNRTSRNVFCRNKKNLYCYAHGATFCPLTGVCLHGPAMRMGLIPLETTERDSAIYLADTEYQFYSSVL